MRKGAQGTGQQLKTVIGFDSLIAQDRAVHQLKTAVCGKRTPNAFLFYGEEGVGKKSAARAVAMACNCSEIHANRFSAEKDGNKDTLFCRPCGRCRSCRKIISGSHPDIHLVEPSGNYIRIEQVRSLFSRIALKPNEALVRVVIIAFADRMNPQSANAILKAMEEPPDNTLFILTAQNRENLLPTILSRCRPVRFNPIPQAQIKSFLISRHNVEPRKAGIIAALARGSISRAVAVKDWDWRDYRNRIIDALDELNKREPARLALFAAKLAEKKQDIEFAFEIMKTWYRDLAVFEYNPRGLVNTDLEERVQTASGRYNKKNLVRKIEAIEDTQRAISANANLRLALDALAIRLST